MSHYPVPPLFRTSDPETSKVAARKAAASGILASQEVTILRIVKANEGSTAKQIAVLSGGEMDQVQVSRRLAGMIAKRMVRYGAASAHDGCSMVFSTEAAP